MGNRITTLTPEFVEFMPKELREGILYISQKYGSAIHLCCCGCGNKTVTPFDFVDSWTLTNNDGLITLRPSIGNWQFPCRSHYYITRNKVDWL